MHKSVKKQTVTKKPRSEKQIEASRRNGQKGGRPRGSTIAKKFQQLAFNGETENFTAIFSEIEILLTKIDAVLSQSDDDTYPEIANIKTSLLKIKLLMVL